MSKTHTFEVGCFVEAYPWDIIEDCEVDDYCNAVPCHHCHSFGTREEKTCFGVVYRQTKTWIVPAAVSASNEGNCNGTLVCADCILEAMAKIRGKQA